MFFYNLITDSECNIPWNVLAYSSMSIIKEACRWLKKLNFLKVRMLLTPLTLKTHHIIDDPAQKEGPLTIHGF